MTGEGLRATYDELTQEGTRLAGRLPQLAQRATVYHHLYRCSDGNHVFPLIAAHGALWAGGYFRFGLRVGRVLVWQYALQPELRRRLLEQLDALADAFRDINRLVCIDTYRNFHFTARFGQSSLAADILPPRILDALNRLHAARAAGQTLTEDEKREVFLAHFLNEQEHVVAPRIQAAVADLDWPLLKTIALRPVIRFAYFGRIQALRFRNFASTDERIEQGLKAFEIGSAQGWPNVESALRTYAQLPETLFSQPAQHFAAMRQKVLSQPVQAWVA